MGDEADALRWLAKAIINSWLRFVKTSVEAGTAAAILQLQGGNSTSESTVDTSAGHTNAGEEGAEMDENSIIGGEATATVEVETAGAVIQLQRADETTEITANAAGNTNAGEKGAEINENSMIGGEATATVEVETAGAVLQLQRADETTEFTANAAGNSNAGEELADAAEGSAIMAGEVIAAVALEPREAPFLVSTDSNVLPLPVVAPYSLFARTINK